MSTEADLVALIRAKGGREGSDLEFKVELRLETPTERAELAKDVALLANQPGGGALVFGVTNSNDLVGLGSPPEVDRIENVLANRLMFVPPGVEIERIPLDSIPGRWALAIRVPRSPWGPRTCFLSADSSWKLPQRIGTSTRYLSPAEAITAAVEAVPGTARVDPSSYFPTSFDEKAPAVREILESNLYPILSLPNTVLRVGVDPERIGRRLEELRGRPRVWALRGDGIFTLRPDSEALEFLEGCRSGRVERLSIDTILRQFDSRRMVIGLLNGEVLLHSTKLGLRFDARSERVFFPDEAGRPRRIEWQAYSRRSSRTVSAPRTIEGIVSHWYHLAAKFSIVDFGNALALSINPGWAFTKNGVDLLERYKVGPLSTKRIAFEDNARFRYNLKFWARYLSASVDNISVSARENGVSISAEPIKIRINVGLTHDSQSPADLDDSGDVTLPDLVPIPDAPEGSGPIGMDR